MCALVNAQLMATAFFDSPNMKAKLIHCHPSDDEIGKIYAPALPLQASPNAVATALATISLPGDYARTAWVAAAKTAFDASFTINPQPGNLDMGMVLEHIRQQLPDDAIITNGAGNFAIWPSKF